VPAERCSAAPPIFPVITPVKKAVIPAAGLGTRLLPVTKVLAKELLPVVDRPASQYVVEEASAAGITHIIFVVSRSKDDIGRYFAPDARRLADRDTENRLAGLDALLSRVSVSCVYQDEPRGLGHAVLCAREAVGDEPCLVILPDDLGQADPPLSAQLLQVYARTGKGVLALEQIPRQHIHRYGVIAGRQEAPRTYAISDLIEKPPPGTEPSDLAIIGRYVLPPEIFPILSRVQAGAGGEIQLTDGLRILQQRHGLYGYVFTGRRHDVGTLPGLLETTLRLAYHKPELRDRLRAVMQELLDEP